MEPLKEVDYTGMVKGELPPSAMVKTMDTLNDILSFDGSSEASETLSSAAHGSSNPPRHDCIDETPPEMLQILNLIQEMGAGMDEFKSRVDKFESVLDHLEIDGLRQADEIKELKKAVGECEREHVEFTELSDCVERCEHEQQRLTECLEQHQADVLAAAAAEVEKACQDAVQRYWAESGAQEARKACEDALERLQLELTAVADEGVQLAERAFSYDPDGLGNEKLAALPPTLRLPKSFPPWSARESGRSCSDLHDGAVHGDEVSFRSERHIVADERTSFSAMAKVESVIEEHWAQFAREDDLKKFEDLLSNRCQQI